MDANRLSRGQQLVELALKNKEIEDRPLESSQSISMLNASTFLRIQGETLQNYRQIKEKDLECNESDNFDLDKEFSQHDLDDSTKDPDWGPEKDSNNNDAIDSENDDSDLEQNNVQSEKSVLEPDNNIIQTDDAGLENTGHTRTKRKKKAPAEWLKNTNKRLRMEGKQYKGVLKNEKGIRTYCIDREQRIMAPSGCTNKCKKSEKRKCQIFEEKEREEIFNGFWQLIWEEKKVFVCNLVWKHDVKQRTTVGASRRKCSYSYFLTKNGSKFPVCKSMFLSTLGIGEKMMYEWILNSKNGIPHKSNVKRPAKQYDIDRKQYAKSFLERLPKLPSHYCRASSSKVYLEPVFQTISELHREYRKEAQKDESPVISRSLFHNILDELNISLFQPRKDQCDTCCGYEAGNINKVMYDQHIVKKEAARAEKNKDKEAALTKDDMKVISLDLQALLMCPLLKASAMYYKTKLSCHNFTIFDMKTKDVICYFWTEVEGDLTSNSFSSCVVDYIMSLDNSIKTLIIYSDGCTYQNRNVTLSNALLKVAYDKKITIFQKYLERGHTQMEVDSVHSVIERKLKNKPIYVPQNYVDIFKVSRLERPYDVKYLSHQFFKKYSDLNYYNSIRPGSKVGDNVVTDIRALMYLPEGEIKYKLAMSGDYLELPRRAKISAPGDTDQVGNLHDSALCIKASKYKHLQELKSVVPRDFHAFYDNLPHA
ncbi:uncharacterized protein [Mytilus edulis]|uniref:uncharacterized protein n=1 Tax=Mytilus edulis TaxID=6550 RepID=UPI0039EEF24A